MRAEAIFLVVALPRALALLPYVVARSSVHLPRAGMVSRSGSNFRKSLSNPLEGEEGYLGEAVIQGADVNAVGAAAPKQLRRNSPRRPFGPRSRISRSDAGTLVVDIPPSGVVRTCEPHVAPSLRSAITLPFCVCRAFKRSLAELSAYRGSPWSCPPH